MGPGSGTFNPSLLQYGGQKWPDIVGALHVKQGWGEAQVSGVIHNVNVTASGDGTNYDPAVAGAICGPGATVLCDGTENKVGWAVDAGVKVNLTTGVGMGNFWGAGDDLVFSGAYSQSAIIYSGMKDGMMERERPGQRKWPADVGRGRVLQSGDQPVVDPDSLVGHRVAGAPLDADHSTPISKLRSSAWTGATWAAAAASRCRAASSVRPRAARCRRTPSAGLIGADIGWNPVTNLNFDLELMYQSTVQAAPSGFLGTVYNLGGERRVLPAGRLEGRQRRFCRPSPHHPLLLIASRSVETDSPGAKAPGFFVAL